MAEQLRDVVSQVTGVVEKYPGYPKGSRAMTIPSGAPSYFLETFGRPERRDKICEREDEPDIAQTMHLISGETLHRSITAEENVLEGWVNQSRLTDEEIVRQLFLATLVRAPLERELSLALAPIRREGSSARRQAFEDLLWAIFNSKEFLFNH